jgi:hypothetical protein
MIAKRITSKAATSRIARLVRYVVAAQGGIDPRSWSRTADYMLASGTSSRREKVGGVRVTNCNTDDPAVATTLIEATQAMNTRSKTDKTYHLVFSFPPGEEPPIDVLRKIEDELVASIGYAEHQRISAVHIDTDHLHVHVAINKVHPKGYQNIEPHFDKLKLMEACERLELEHGLTRTNHGRTGERTKAERQAAMEEHSGIESLTSYVAREVAKPMQEAKSWQELHNAIGTHGLSIKKRGAGFVIGSGKTWIRASSADRSLSIKSLTDRLGEFQEAARGPSNTYQAQPKQKTQSTSKLFDKYQQERQSRMQSRQNALQEIRQETEALNASLQRWRFAQRALIKATMKGSTRRAALKLVSIQTSVARNNNKKAISERRQKVIVATSAPGWAMWLAHQAENGNSEALRALRSREAAAMNGNTLFTASNTAGKNGIMTNLQPRIDKQGRATYRTADGGVVIDRQNQVQSYRTTSESTLIALELASKRFTGKALVVEGQDEFKREVARLAGARGLEVCFSDPVMEKTRKENQKQKHKGIEL